MTDDILLRLERIEEKLDQISDKLNKVDKSAKKMDDHIEYVEGYVNIIPSCGTLRTLMGNVFGLQGMRRLFLTQHEEPVMHFR
ncbi:MAG: hypothetical protein CMK59_02840 [Proteobacteria bacterium]|nr:hypothetical protein [Pseudomonadota bacterium]